MVMNAYYVLDFKWRVDFNWFPYSYFKVLISHSGKEKVNSYKVPIHLFSFFKRSVHNMDLNRIFHLKLSWQIWKFESSKIQIHVMNGSFDRSVLMYIIGYWVYRTKTLVLGESIKVIFPWKSNGRRRNNFLLRCSDTLPLGHFFCFSSILSLIALKFTYFEKATKNWKKSPTLFWR